MGARFIKGLSGAALLAAVAFFGSTLAAQERGERSSPFVDPSSGSDPFDGGVSSDAGPQTDPSLGADPFEDGGWAPRPAPSSSAPASSSQTVAVPEGPPRTRAIAEALPPSPAPTPLLTGTSLRESAAREDELVFRFAHGTLRLLLLVQPQLSWEFFNAAGSPNAGADGVLPTGVDANATYAQQPAPLGPDGTTTNRGTFRLRRARVGFELTTRSIFGARVEIDPNLADRENPVSGTIVRRLELVASAKNDARRFEVGAGVFDVPFSRDLAEAHGARIFVARTYGTRAMFPEDADMGVRLRRTYFPLGFDVQLALMNGVTVGEPSFGRAPDLNKTKDASARIAIDLSRFEVGAGGYVGQGQAVDAAASRVQQRVRAAISIDALFRMRLARSLRETRLSGEVVVGRNMDRGVLTPFATMLPADPTVSLPNFDPRNAWIRLEQDFRLGTIGVRYDAYTPDSSEAENSRHTLSAAVARSLSRNTRLMLEYDHVIDQIHAPTSPTRAKLVEVLSIMAQLRY